MNRRLLTPVIVLFSFAATLGFMSWHTGPWHASSAQALSDTVPAPVPAALTAAATLAPPAAAPGEPIEPAAPAVMAPEALPAAQPEAGPATEDAPPAVPSQPQPLDADKFLDARDRAAEHSARSR